MSFHPFWENSQISLLLTEIFSFHNIYFGKVKYAIKMQLFVLKYEDNTKDYGSIGSSNDGESCSLSLSLSPSSSSLPHAFPTSLPSSFSPPTSGDKPEHRACCKLQGGVHFCTFRCRYLLFCGWMLLFLTSRSLSWSHLETREERTELLISGLETPLCGTQVCKNSSLSAVFL